MHLSSSSMDYNQNRKVFWFYFSKGRGGESNFLDLYLNKSCVPSSWSQFFHAPKVAKSEGNQHHRLGARQHEQYPASEFQTI